jgi:predicted dehydrogenase
VINVGIIGLGMMGSTHLDVYAKREDVQIYAVSDIIPARLSGEEVAAGNVEGQAQGGADLSRTKRYPEGKLLIADPQVQLVDICLPTPIHMEYAVAALEAGKHVMVEKPLARTHADAMTLADAAAQSTGMSMCGMCMRFWPGWDWLKKAIEENTYGKVLAAHFRRVASHPGGPFYLDGDACGGAVLDLHIHDTDFIQYCFGTPAAVFSRGYAKITGQIDHVVTQYIYDDGPAVSAEGGWAMADGFGFQMQYTVNFEHATAEFSFDGKNNLRLIESGKEPCMLEVGDGMGYEREIDYFLKCIQNNVAPGTVTPAQAAESVRIVEAEAESIASGQIVKL